MTRVYEIRGRSRDAAALFIGVKPTKFDELVADGRMPQPYQIDGRVVWDVYELDDAFERLPKRGLRPAAPVLDDHWDRMAA
jgi:predicted DNA-binding transcriptional regulator AlpA